MSVKLSDEDLQQTLTRLREELKEALRPVDVLLFCPMCHLQHIDRAGSQATEDEAWTNPPHKTHLCAHCGCRWRPSDRETNGVARIETAGKEDTWMLTRAKI